MSPCLLAFRWARDFSQSGCTCWPACSCRSRIVSRPGNVVCLGHTKHERTALQLNVTPPCGVCLCFEYPNKCDRVARSGTDLLRSCVSSSECRTCVGAARFKSSSWLGAHLHVCGRYQLCRSLARRLAVCCAAGTVATRMVPLTSTKLCPGDTRPLQLNCCQTAVLNVWNTRCHWAAS